MRLRNAVSRFGEILTVATHRMFSRSGMSGVYKILNFLTGAGVYSHQIPRATRTCMPHLLAQLARVDVPHFQGDYWQTYPLDRS